MPSPAARRWMLVALVVVGACFIVGGLVAGGLVIVNGRSADPTPPTVQVITYPKQDKSEGPDLTSTDVMFAATGITKTGCKPDREYRWNSPGQSFSCTVGRTSVRVARYRSAKFKADRLAHYGTCTRLSGGWKLCGPNPETGRWVRTFVTDDVLFYVSADDKSALVTLDAQSEAVVRRGS